MIKEAEVDGISEVRIDKKMRASISKDACALWGMGKSSALYCYGLFLIGGHIGSSEL